MTLFLYPSANYKVKKAREGARHYTERERNSEKGGINRREKKRERSRQTKRDRERRRETDRQANR